jgi:hypothetical protein
MNRKKANISLTDTDKLILNISPLLHNMRAEGKNEISA